MGVFLIIYYYFVNNGCTGIGIVPEYFRFSSTPEQLRLPGLPGHPPDGGCRTDTVLVLLKNGWQS